jgi:hypothetical protein
VQRVPTLQLEFHVSLAVLEMLPPRFSTFLLLIRGLLVYLPIALACVVLMVGD